jgi:hypothetical protein
MVPKIKNDESHLRLQEGRLRTIRALIPSLAVLLCVMVFPARKDAPPEPIAQADTSSHNILWKADTLGTYGSALLDIFAVSPMCVFAVGVIWDYSGTVPTYLMKWDGVQWTGLLDDSLRLWISGGVPLSVHALADTAVFITSTRFVKIDPLPMAAYWNGKKWKNITPTTTSLLLGIWAKSLTEVYAVGTHGLIMRYDGSEWHLVSSPPQLDYQDIFGLPNGDVYATACNPSNSYMGSVLVRLGYNVATVEMSRGIGRLFSVGGTTTNDLYVVGEGVFHRGTNGTWPEIATPEPLATMLGVFGRETNDVIVVGSFGKAIHWNGQSWKSFEELYDRSATSRFYRACVTGSRYFIVGDTGTRALLAFGVPQR